MTDMESYLIKAAAAYAATKDEAKNASPHTEQAANTEKYLTLKELANILSVHPVSLHRWMIPRHKWGGRPRFLLSECTRYLDSQDFRNRLEELRKKRRATQKAHASSNQNNQTTGHASGSTKH